MKRGDWESIRPTTKRRIMDLVAEAGVDVSDWKNYSKPNVPSANPNYCYQWAFLEPEKVLVLNLWHEEIQDRQGGLACELRPRLMANELRKNGGKHNQIARAEKMHELLVRALRDQLPIRVVACDGRRRDISEDPSSSSRVNFRKLDPVAWHIARDGSLSGNWLLKRGLKSPEYVDQFSAENVVADDEDLPQRRLTERNEFNRKKSVQDLVLSHAKGHCEWCGEPGFLTPSGKLFLETHHVQPLSQNGADHPSNVIALCPNHHREAHYGANPEWLKTAMLACIMERSTRKKAVV